MSLEWMNKEWRDSLVTLLMSWVLGEVGADRFYRGQKAQRIGQFGQNLLSETRMNTGF